MPRKTKAGCAQKGARGASMRPRPDAAENLAGVSHMELPAIRFNEAAARCRGKLPCQYFSRACPTPLQ